MEIENKVIKIFQSSNGVFSCRASENNGFRLKYLYYFIAVKINKYAKKLKIFSMFRRTASNKNTNCFIHIFVVLEELSHKKRTEITPLKNFYIQQESFPFCFTAFFCNSNHTYIHQSYLQHL